ncbi:hypothetical protein [Streptomyces acidicola]|uniref:Uncharacterized protein n=1 Tax=Streptomyces acidicola TaxID=2596892 RepID=A0A5N8X4W7_9ACTN|nr:hypothetical protein [Streptomyces acidicola]MPY53978.1 hypothetical protein [Streptomyces acidicola]
MARHPGGPPLHHAPATPELEHFYDNVLDDSTYEGPEPPTTSRRTLSCPECGTDRDLVITGRWTDPARMTCPDGHEWTEDMVVDDDGTTLMQMFIKGSDRYSEYAC